MTCRATSTLPTLLGDRGLDEIAGEARLVF